MIVPYNPAEENVKPTGWWESPFVLLAIPFLTLRLISTIAIVLLLVLLAVPHQMLFSIWLHRKWKRFREEYQSRGRLVDWADLKSKLSEGKGTLIAEEDSQLGYRFWWTEDKLTPQNTPPPLPENEMFDLTSGRFGERSHPYIDWFQQRYLDLDHGRAALIDDPHCHIQEFAKDRASLEKFPGVPIVWTAMTGIEPCRRN